MNTPPAPSPAPASPAAVRPQRGRGLRLTANALGYSFSGAGGAQSFAHPFKPSLGAGGITLAKGLIEFMEPRIGQVPVSGDATHGAPALPLEAKVATEAGESWVCAELEIDAQTGVPVKDTWPQIVHASAPVLHAPFKARAPLVLIVWRLGRPWRAVPFAYFNLRYARVEPPPGRGLVRHLFF